MYITVTFRKLHTTIDTDLETDRDLGVLNWKDLPAYLKRKYLEDWFDQQPLYVDFEEEEDDE